MSYLGRRLVSRRPKVIFYVMEEKMNLLTKNSEHHFYPEGAIEKFYINFQTSPSRPDVWEQESENMNETQNVENPFKDKTWTKTTNSWV